MGRKSFTMLALSVLMLVLLVVPVGAWVTPGPGTTFDENFEMFGPRLDKIKIQMFHDQDAMWLALANNETDITDWPLNKNWYDQFNKPQYYGIVKKVPYNGEAGFFLFDLNHNNNTYLGNPPGTPKNPDTGQPYPNPLYGYPEPGSWNPCSNVWFRRALAYLTNRALVPQLGLVIYTPVPSYMEPIGWVNTDIKPGGALEALCYLYSYENACRMLAYPGIKWEPYCNKTIGSSNYINVELEAYIHVYEGEVEKLKPDGTWEVVPNCQNISYAPGSMLHVKSTTAKVCVSTGLVFWGNWITFPRGLDGKRYWDKNANGKKDPGEAIKVKMWVRTDLDDINIMAIDLALQMSNIGIDYALNLGGGGTCYQHYMLEKDGTFYTACWTFIGPEPDYLYDLFHSSMHWHSPEVACPNTMFVNDPVLDDLAEGIKFAPSLAAAVQSTWDFQVRFAEMVHAIPLYSRLGVKASRVTYLGDGDATGPEDIYEGKNWKQIVNEQGFGTNCWWTFFNAHPEGFMYGNGEMSVRYAWSSVYYPLYLNILYAQDYWDHEILDKIYDTLAKRNPNNPSEYIPWMVKTWETGWWPITMHALAPLVRITLRPDIKWHDGTPVTIADVYYTFVCARKLLAKGYPPPWWYPAVQYFIDCYIVDPYTIEMLFTRGSIWIEQWVLTAVPIIPRHIWAPIIEEGNPTQFQPDVHMIGSGPWKLVSCTPGGSAELEANRDYFRYCPVEVNVHADDYKVKFELPHAPATPPPPPLEIEVNFTVTLHNLFLNCSNGGFLYVDKYVYIDGITVVEEHNIPLYSCTPEIETVSKVLPKCRHDITVAVQIVGPDHMTYDGIQQANPWLNRWINVTLYVWVTITEDIATVDAYWLPVFKNAGVQHPDCAVDMKDLYECVLAFGTSPGHPKWNSICDINGDYKADMKDLYGVVLMFGKW
ncbi:MAG: ABC transporter substrate-binding protein [Candidatus Bathyarchaeia archaeon]